MATYTIDSHETVRQFVAAGIKTEQAELIVTAIGRAGRRVAWRAPMRSLEGGRDRRGSHAMWLPRLS